MQPEISWCDWMPFVESSSLSVAVWNSLSRSVALCLDGGRCRWIGHKRSRHFARHEKKAAVGPSLHCLWVRLALNSPLWVNGNRSNEGYLKVYVSECKCNGLGCIFVRSVLNGQSEKLKNTKKIILSRQMRLCRASLVEEHHHRTRSHSLEDTLRSLDASS